MDYLIRVARPQDVSAISALIASSARGLSRQDYNEEQIEAAVSSIYGVDSELISDGTYFVADAGDVTVGCGGWSRRKTLFGGDQAASRETGVLDPARDAAKIRAFFVHPIWARRGIGRALLERCEQEAQAAGFKTVELMSTLPGINFYRAMGYEASEPILYHAAGTALEFVPMRKQLPKKIVISDVALNKGGPNE
ncbi:MAG TPA: GNAT family N-acetyltransferase [Pyrinomonadaceae bacterium]|nr:GNAT family N-acetyltransferase [Pyrinomonadaceae bacterium]